MTDAVTFDAANVDDLACIVELKIAMFRETGHAAALHPSAAALILDDYRQLYADRAAQHFIARSGPLVVACAGAFLKNDLPFRYFRCPVYGFIGDVYTDPRFRRQQIARRLSQDALSWLRCEGVEMVRLLASDAGRAMYTTLGFTRTDEMAIVFAP